MFRTCVLALLCLVVKQASPFSWDILVGQARTLYFYSNKTLTYTQDIPYSNQITSVTYDSVHNRILFSDVDYPNMTICSYDITSKTTKSLLTKKIDGFNVRVVYDPVTQLLVWSDASNIYKLSLNPISVNKTVNGKNIVTLDHHCRDVAVDSCGGYIYWMTDYNIERARVSAEGQPECSCQAGYSGKRCEVHACHQYCLHNGTCSLNEEEEPTCECSADYEGDRCEVATTRAGEEADGSTQQVLRDLRSAVRQVLREELKSILKLFSDKLDEDEASAH
ncbi:hypothetical protein PYW08_012124 [Mythimna loreyi]|uniref:Uncharacterized protein n=1 Tax=Mythimna loreyi TaxID=667449 RepID=A0ACC2PZD7_9NEOP|nr:hypothetical protein PYW08_012124 [Mythimna loreyi]